MGASVSPCVGKLVGNSAVGRDVGVEKGESVSACVGKLVDNSAVGREVDIATV